MNPSPFRLVLFGVLGAVAAVPAQPGWGAPIPIDTSTEPKQSPAVALNDFGPNGHLAWVSGEEVSVATFDSVTRAVGTPTKLFDGTGFCSQCVDDLHLHADGLGDATAILQIATDPARTQVVAFRFASATGWTTAGRLVDWPVNNLTVDLQGTLLGNVYVTVTPPVPSLETTLFHAPPGSSTYSAGQALPSYTPFAVTGFGAFPLAANGLHVATILEGITQRVMLSSGPGSAANPDFPIGIAPTSTYSIEHLFDLGGNWTIVAASPAGLFARTRVAATGAFAAFSPITTRVASPEGPRLGADAAGNVFVAWQDATLGTLWLKRLNRATGTWSADVNTTLVPTDFDLAVEPTTGRADLLVALASGSLVSLELSPALTVNAEVIDTGVRAVRLATDWLGNRLAIYTALGAAGTSSVIARVFAP
ncbi:MAG: hypothetical protein AAF628_14205 [Planctomycetota bacterium]